MLAKFLTTKANAFYQAVSKLVDSKATNDGILHLHKIFILKMLTDIGIAHNEHHALE